MEVLKLKTFYLNSMLDDNVIDKYNSSNSVIISKNLFQEITNKDSDNTVNIIGLYYKGKKIYVDIIDTHIDDPNIMYVPEWIYKYLNYEEDELVNYMQVHPKVGNKVKIKPRGDFYAYLDDPISALRNGFERYSCLLKDTVILLNIDGIPLEVEIVETYIKNQPIYIRGVELEVDIEETIHSIDENNENNIIEPLDEIKPTIDDNFDSMLPYMPIQSENKFKGKGYSLK